jgi:hypothetical protein
MEKVILSDVCVKEIEHIHTSFDKEHEKEVNAARLRMSGLKVEYDKLQNFLDSIELAKSCTVKGFLICLISDVGDDITQLKETPRLSDDGREILYELTKT